MACSLQARSGGTSPEYWSGWVLQLAHLASAENRQDVGVDNVRSLHSTTKSPGDPRDAPLDSHNFLSKLQDLSLSAWAFMFSLKDCQPPPSSRRSLMTPRPWSSRL